MMRKLMTMIVVVLLMLALGAWTPRPTIDRCPFCGAADAFTWYGTPGNSFGICSKCAETTDRHTISGYVYGNDGRSVIVELYKGGKLIRSNAIPENAVYNGYDFISVNRGYYTMAIKCDGYYTVYRIVNAHHDINNLNITLRPRHCR